MTLDRRPWKRLSFPADKEPPWSCNCGGSLSKKKDTFTFTDSPDLPNAILNLTTEELPNRPYFQYRFVGIFECNNCNINTSVMGYAYAIDRHKEPVPHSYFDKMGKVLVPVAFDPPLEMFQIPIRCPAQIQLEVRNSFYHYWSDRSSCANRIRAVLELIMDQLEIEGKTLHSRIEKYKKDNAEIGTLMLSVKWIGNAGSHVQGVNKIDLLDAFQVLEHVLNELYRDEDKLRRIKDLADKINEQRGPISQIKSGKGHTQLP